MKKQIILAALAAIALAGCTSDDFVGNSATQQGGPESAAIQFSGGAPNMTRAQETGLTAANKLAHQFLVYGTKKLGTDEYQAVFPSYKVWWDGTTNPTTSNLYGWEYVGTNATYGATDQGIKYWDYSAEEYHFVAGSPINAFTFTTDANGEVTGATVNGIKGHVMPNTTGTHVGGAVYVAEPVKVAKASYNQKVLFTFTGRQALVRVGFYETIPGYKVTSIKFRTIKEDGTWDMTGSLSDNVVLAAKTSTYFRGGTGSATITYDWTTPSYTYSPTVATDNYRNWYGGKLINTPVTELATSSTNPTNSTDVITQLYGNGDDDQEAETGYFPVLPTLATATSEPLFIKCDYVLTAEDGPETITVRGATAAVPAAYTKWKANHAYTYLFKISDNTNGTTGEEGTDPDGLFPITFDAVVEADNDATEGFVTTVTTPSITTYQNGAVKNSGMRYIPGTAVYFTVQDDATGTLYNLTAANVKVFKLDGEATEADLQLTAPTTEVTATVGAAAWTINGQTIAAGNYATFTPAALTGTNTVEYYAIQYKVDDTPTYAYKVVRIYAAD
ncbi:MAG: hypothetical protein IJS59_05610 [Bacteroidaceae bacterium]|nr:hypothetical protein [Bacteroidaceae bacterium]